MAMGAVPEIEQNTIPIQPVILTSHVPIRINGNVNFTAPNGVSGGSGTVGNPYIIDNWDIDGVSTGDCIYVGNTTKYFIIRNCTLYNASSLYGIYYRNAGVDLYNCSNATVTNCSIYDNGVVNMYVDDGTITYPRNIKVHNNTFTEGYNIFWVSFGGVISNNQFNGSLPTGHMREAVRVFGGGGQLRIENNTITDTTGSTADFAINIISNSHNVSMSNNTMDGIRISTYIDNANDCIVINSRFYNTDIGLNVTTGTNISIINNTIGGTDWNDGYGLDLNSITNLIVNNNTITEFREGIHIDDSHNVTISYNNISTPVAESFLGIKCTRFNVPADITNYRITKNNITNMSYGIWVEYCNNLTVDNNTEVARSGVFVDESSNVLISNNTITNLTGSIGSSGILFEDSISGTIQENNVSNYGSNIWLQFSEYINITDNWIEGGTYGLVYSTIGPGPTNVVHNTFYNVNEGIRANLLVSTIYHNNFYLTSQNPFTAASSSSTYDKGHQFGGNYYNWLTTTDDYHGYYQDKPGGDNIRDTSLHFGVGRDYYPLTQPYQTNNTPVADAGYPPQRWGGLRRLYGNDSSDAGGTSLNYTWWFVYDGSPVTLYGMQVDFWFNITGLYNITLNVTDDNNNMDTTWVDYNITEIPVFFDEGIRTDATGVYGDVWFDTTYGRFDVQRMGVGTGYSQSTAGFKIAPDHLYNSTFIFEWSQWFDISNPVVVNDYIIISFETNVTTNGVYQMKFYSNVVYLGTTPYGLNYHESQWVDWTAIVDNTTRKIHLYRGDTYIGNGANISGTPSEGINITLTETGTENSMDLYIDKMVWYNYTSPTANAGPDQYHFEGTHYFDGSASVGSIFNYTWNFTFNGTPITLWGINPSFNFDRSGDFFVTLNTSNPITYVTDTMWMNITNRPPVADAGGSDTTYRGTYNFDGTGSYDLDGYITNYTWSFTYNASMRYMYGDLPSYWFWTLGAYFVTLNVTDDEGDYDLEIIILTIINTPPVADAGPDQAGLKAVYLFDGSNSYDSDGSITNYTWTFTYNASAQFMYGAFPNFYFYTNGSYIVTLTVTDNDAATDVDTLWINITWLPPVADAGPNQAGKRIITFDGSGSSDGDGWIVNYTWNFTYGGPQTLWGVSPSFDFNATGVYIVMLNVTDNDGLYVYDNVTITITILSPVANAGPDQAGLRGTYDFDGSGSSDADGTITNYTWTFTYNATGRTLYGVNPDYYFYTDGNYQTTLTIRDDDWRTDTDTIWINITLATPVPVINYVPFNDNKGTKTVDGSDSYDLDGYITNYTWTFTYDGTPYTYYTDFFQFDFLIEGDYAITLNLTDSDALQDETTIILSIVLKDPIANAGDDMYEQSWTDMILNGSQSYDIDGYLVNWTWEFTYDNITYTLYGEVVTFHLGTANGTVNVTLTVTDDDGLTGTDTMIVIVINPITASLNLMVIVLPLLVALLVMFLIYRLMRKTQKDLRKKGEY